MRRFLFLFVACGLLCHPVIANAEPAKATSVEHVFVSSPPASGILATKQYTPSEEEQSFFERLAKEDAANAPQAGKIARAKKYVGLFGIVREINEDTIAGKTTLTVENKYFDGLTDAHQMVVSFNGSGDFQAVLSGTGHSIPLLSLVRVYGKSLQDEATQAKNDKRDCVNADFVRVWHWKTFAFLSAYGTQCGNAKWQKLNQVPLLDLYTSEPDDDYYEKRLGKRPDAAQTRKRLLDAAGKVTPEVQDALERLIADLCAGWSVEKYDLREAEIKKIIEILDKLDAKEAATAVLLQAMQENDNRIRFMASNRFDCFCESPKTVVRPLLELLKHNDPRVRAGVADTLAWRIPLDDDQAPEVVEALVRCTNDKYTCVKTSAVCALGRLGSKAQEAVPTLKPLLKDKELEVRYQAAEALWEITSKADQALPVFIEVLENGDEDQRYTVAEKLGEMGPLAASAIPALIKALKDDVSYNRSNAAEALGMIGPKAAAAVPALITTLKGDEDSHPRACAAEALGEIGDAKAIPAVIKALNDEDDFVQFMATNALEMFGPKAKTALPVLVKRVTEKKENVWNTLAAIGSIDTEGTTVPVFVDALKDKDATVRRFAAIGLARIGRNAQAAKEALHQGMKDKNAGARVEAANAYAIISGEVDEVMEVLLDALESKNDWIVQMWAADAVAMIGPEAKAAVPELMAGLRSDAWQLRSSSAEALGKIGPAAKASLPALRLLLKDSDSDVQEAAIEAIRQIEGK